MGGAKYGGMKVGSNDGVDVFQCLGAFLLLAVVAVAQLAIPVGVIFLIYQASMWIARH